MCAAVRADDVLDLFVRRNEENSCPTAFPSQPSVSVAGEGVARPLIAPVTVSTLLFMYTWPASGEELTYSGVPLSSSPDSCSPSSLSSRTFVLSSVLPGDVIGQDKAAAAMCGGCPLSSLLDAVALAPSNAPLTRLFAARVQAMK